MGQTKHGLVFEYSDDFWQNMAPSGHRAGAKTRRSPKNMPCISLHRHRHVYRTVIKKHKNKNQLEHDLNKPHNGKHVAPLGSLLN